MGSNPDLSAHSAEFKQEVIKVTDGVYVDIIAGFSFPDSGEAYTVHVRKGVAEIQPEFPDDPDISLTVDSNVWKEVVTGFRNPAVALVKDVDKEGGMLKIIKFLNLFKSDD